MHGRPRKEFGQLVPLVVGPVGSSPTEYRLVAVGARNHPVCPVYPEEARQVDSLADRGSCSRVRKCGALLSHLLACPPMVPLRVVLGPPDVEPLVVVRSPAGG